MYDEHPATDKGWQPLDLDALIEKQLAELSEQAKEWTQRMRNLRSELRQIGR